MAKPEPAANAGGVDLNCDAKARKVLDQALAEGQDDSTAWRAHDKVWLACLEAERAAEPPEEPEPDPACTQDERHWQQPAPVDERHVAVFFTCPGRQNPSRLAWRLREIAPDAGLQERIEYAYRAQIDGPTRAEADEGYGGTFLPADFGEVLVSASVSDGRAILNFSPKLASLNNLSTATAGMSWFSKLAVVPFQFEAVKQVELQMDGSCERFYGDLFGEFFASEEGSCQILEPGDDPFGTMPPLP